MYQYKIVFATTWCTSCRENTSVHGVCGWEDSNLHGISPTSPSSWRGYHYATPTFIQNRRIRTYNLSYTTMNVRVERNQSLASLARSVYHFALSYIVGSVGFEPTTPWVSVTCSNQTELRTVYKVARGWLEQPTLWVWITRSSQLSYLAIMIIFDVPMFLW